MKSEVLNSASVNFKLGIYPDAINNIINDPTPFDHSTRNG